MKASARRLVFCRSLNALHLACANRNPKLPDYIPVALHKNDTTTTKFEVDIPQEHLYAVQLRYPFRKDVRQLVLKPTIDLNAAAKSNQLQGRARAS